MKPIIIIKKPDIQWNKMSIYTIPQINIRFNCVLLHNRFKGEDKIKEASAPKKASDKPQLQIQKVTAEDSGCYTCESVMLDGTKCKELFHVHVDGKIDFIPVNQLC